MTTHGSQTPRRIAVINAKGGSGKTTCATNIAGALSENGHDTLLIDLDPQGSATEAMGFRAEYDSKPPSLFDVITSPGAHSKINSLILEHDEFDVLPSNVDMLYCERELIVADLMAQLKFESEIDPEPLVDHAINVSPDQLTHEHAKHFLNDALEELNHTYDYVVIDSPPFFGELSDMAMYTAPNLIVPALTEAASERSIELLFDQVAKLQEETGVKIDEVGAVANRVENTNEDREMLRWFNTVFRNVPVWEVRKRVALQRSFSEGESILQYAPNNDMSDVFRNIAEDINDHFDDEQRTEVPA